MKTSSLSDSLTPETLQGMHAYWRAANYLSVGQIYLKDNPLLECPLTLADIKPRLLGHLMAQCARSQKPRHASFVPLAPGQVFVDAAPIGAQGEQELLRREAPRQRSQQVAQIPDGCDVSGPDPPQSKQEHAVKQQEDGTADERVWPIEDVAADFGVTLLVVQRRLKLANQTRCSNESKLRNLARTKTR